MILFIFILTIILLFLVLIKIYWFMIDKIEEDKKIEKLDRCAVVSGDLGCEWSFTEKILKDKINEIIDKINGDK